MFKSLVHIKSRGAIQVLAQSFSISYQDHLSKMVKAKRFIVAKHFKDEPKSTDLQLVEEELPSLQNGEYLVQAEYLSVDPYMRPYVQRYPVGITMIGSQVGKIIESKNPEFPVGKRILGYLGWRTHTIVNPQSFSGADFISQKPMLLPDIGDVSPSLCLGVLGMPGNTAYFGLMEICKPKEGETLVVSGAAGAVGSHVGAIGKNVLGLTVIGIAGSDEKCKWLVDKLGFDHAINYKTENVATALRKAAPNGVDCYFDNVCCYTGTEKCIDIFYRAVADNICVTYIFSLQVGGDISSAVIYQMKPFGRVSVCGSISSYNADASSLPKTTILQPAMVFNQLKIEGFIVTRWSDRWSEGIQKNLQWIREGKIHHRETVTKGFDKMFDAFDGMLNGKNVGKAIIEV